VTTIPRSEPLPVAVRAYAPPPSRRRELLPPSEYTVTWDCETDSDTAQELRFGAYQVRESGRLIRTGLFYRPGIPEHDLAVLCEYAAAHGLELLTLAEFVEDVFFHYLSDLGGTCVGFNLPFDISKIAIGHVPGKNTGRGGFSFELTEDDKRDRVRVVHRSSTAARIELVPRHQRRMSDHPGHFVDVRSLARALTGESHSLESLTRQLQTEHRKEPSDEHGGPVAPEYVAYAVNDVAATWDCFATLAGRYESYKLSRPITRVTSEASIGKASLEQIDVRPWRTVQPDYPPEMIGRIISSYFGGRAEIRRRLEIAEAAYCDFKSMYTTICALQGLWSFMIAYGINHHDATDEVRDLLERITLEDLQEPALWRELTVLVQVRPDCDFLPTRCQFGAGEQYGLAQSFLSSSTGELLWFTLADCVSSTLRTGKPPEVVQAVRFVPRHPQYDLRPLDVAGNPDYRVDPYSDDLFVRLIDLRGEVKRHAAAARAAGDDALAERLGGEEQSLKITSSATSYGIMIELNPDELDKPTTTDCYGLDGERFAAQVRRHEQPGRCFHPLIATLITGGARLMLTLAELKAAQEGIGWLFCDTDSLAFTRPDGITRQEFQAAVERVRPWFRPLSPYAGKPDLLELEDVNYQLIDGDSTGELEPLYGLAISPKRYVLYNLTKDGAPIIRKGSAHGLGHLLAPYNENESPPDIPPPILPLHELELARWQYDLWYRIIEAALAGSEVDFATLPNFERPAMASCAVTTTNVEKWFRDYNTTRPYAQRIRPFGFFITPTVRAFDVPLGRAGHPFRLVAPFETDGATWVDGTYIDIYTGNTYAISTQTYDEQTALVQTYRQIAAAYIAHPDPKRLGPDGRVCCTDTTGLLGPRHIDAFHVEQLGKEANKLEQVQAGLAHQADEVYTRYQAPRRDPFTRLALPVLRTMPREDLLAAEILEESQLREVLAERARPHPDARTKLMNLAVGHARSQLRTTGRDDIGHPLAALHAYLQDLAAAGPPACARTGCKKPALPGGAYCGDACRQAAYRERRARAS
jgi:hypothetical protein